MTFVSELKEALVADCDARFVFLGNFEVERLWAVGAPRLPGASISFAAATVNRMEELGLLLADRHDVVVLKSVVDADYRSYLESLGFELPQTLVVDSNDPEATVTQDAVRSPALLAALSAMNDGRTYLCPLGVSDVEQQLSELSGLPLATPSPEVCRSVNSKVYSRELCRDLGLCTIPGRIVRSADDLAQAIEAHRHSGICTVKEPLGVSGRGQVVIRNERQANSLVRMLHRSRGAVEFVVEEWIQDAIDVNYQILVSRQGAVSIHAIKEAIVTDGVHRGHRFPAQLTPEQREILVSAGHAIGARLFADGYFGVAGIDALIAADGTVYPCLEINARFNMSTYQNNLFGASTSVAGRAVQFGVSLDRPASFEGLRAALATTLASSAGRPGVVLTNFATVNAGVSTGHSGAGRVYAVITADSEAEITELHDSAGQAIEKWAAA